MIHPSLRRNRPLLFVQCGIDCRGHLVVLLHRGLPSSLKSERPYFQPSESDCGRLAARRIHGYLGGIEAGRSEVREAG